MEKPKNKAAKLGAAIGTVIGQVIFAYAAAIMIMWDWTPLFSEMSSIERGFVFLLVAVNTVAIEIKDIRDDR